MLGSRSERCLSPNQISAAARRRLGHNFIPRRGGSGRRDRSALFVETTAMIVLVLILSVFAVGFLCWLLFARRQRAALLRRHDDGSFRLSKRLRDPWRPSRRVRCGSGHTCRWPNRFCRRQIACASRSDPLLFVAPAAIAGYYATLGLAQSACPLGGWRDFRCVGAIFVGGTASVRVAAMLSPPDARTHWRGLGARLSR